MLASRTARAQIDTHRRSDGKISLAQAFSGFPALKGPHDGKLWMFLVRVTRNRYSGEGDGEGTQKKQRIYSKPRQ
jgi:hypothetical protein